MAGRRRLLVVMDVDSTFITQEVIELLAEHAGTQSEVAAVTEAAMRGEIDFAASLEARCRTLAGLPVSVFEDVRRAVRVSPGAAVLVSTLLDRGDAVGLVSGGFVEIVEPLARDHGIRHARANRLEVRGGRLTGAVVPPVVDRAAKAAALGEFADLEGLPLQHTVAIGDGANDLDMLAAAGLGIAFNAKPVVRSQADAALTSPSLADALPLIDAHRDARVG